ncbi:MAG: hypothetical protein LBT08_10720 [Synergistaceae bacterium]|jgi:hypothetical protein|nr:hypothetical protein [Synergistaceae bacterium]
MATHTINRQEIHQTIDALPDTVMGKLAEYVLWLTEEQEIAELEAKYGTTPNAETIAAMKDAEAGIGESVTLEEIRARCNALR